MRGLKYLAFKSQEEEKQGRGNIWEEPEPMTILWFNSNDSQSGIWRNPQRGAADEQL